MSIDEQHVALPKLYGAPAYARPQPPVTPAARPFDPDDLPIAAVRTVEEQEFAESLPARAYVPGGGYGAGADTGNGSSDSLAARPFRLRSIADRLFGSST